MKTPPTTHLFITYALLDQDLSGAPDPTRRALWQRLIRLLSLPKGSIAFWPIALCEEVEPSFHLDVFFDSLALFPVSHILFFGDDLRDRVTAVTTPDVASRAATFRFFSEPQAYADLSDANLARVFTRLLDDLRAAFQG